jgi:hypothetical protein
LSAEQTQPPRAKGPLVTRSIRSAAISLSAVGAWWTHLAWTEARELPAVAEAMVKASGVDSFDQVEAIR